MQYEKEINYHLVFTQSEVKIMKEALTEYLDGGDGSNALLYDLYKQFDEMLK